jgi:Xaa-Pro dipeptidase
LISLQTGHAILLVPELPPDYATIMGRIRSPEEWKAKHGVNAVRYTNQLDQIIREGEESPKVYCLEGRNSDSDSLYKAPLETITSLMKHGFHVDTDILFPVVANSRVFKSEAELSLLRHVSELTSFAHAYVFPNGMWPIIFNFRFSATPDYNYSHKPHIQSYLFLFLLGLYYLGT